MPTFHHAPPLRSRDVTLELDLDAIDADEPTLSTIGAPAPDREAEAARALRRARLRAKAAREEGRVEDAITELKRALHATRDRATCRAIFGELADIYASQGERSEAGYYAKRAGRPAPPVMRPTRGTAHRVIPPPPPPRARLQ